MILLLPSLLSSILLSSALPLRGNDPWTVILCKYRDNPHEPLSTQWVHEWIHGRNPDTISNFFYTVSNGVYTIDGSNVTEWIQLPWTRDDVLELAKMDKDLGGKEEEPFALFDKAKQLCSGWAAATGTNLRPRRIVLLNSERTAVFGRSNGVLISPRLAYSSVLAHEMVHSMNIGHSYSERKNRVFPHGAPGEYGDRYDLMSTANAWMHSTRFGWAGPGLAGPHLEYLGWIPMERMLFYGGDPAVPRRSTLRLSSLSVPHSSSTGTLLLLLPYDRDEAANLFTVEYRTPHGNDVGLKQAGVVIHKIRKVGPSFYSYLITHNGFDELTPGTEWVRFIRGGLVRVRVEEVVNWSDVRITVLSTFDPSSCLGTENRIPVHLSDDEFDGDKKQKQLKKWFSPVKKETALGKEPLGHVCIERHRPLAHEDMERQRLRNAFFKRRSFGQNECVEGREWRGLDSYDYVCVLPHRVAESRRSVLRRSSNGRCPWGFTRRMAFDDDFACVSAHERALIMTENRAATKFYKHARFFNGDDDLIVR